MDLLVSELESHLTSKSLYGSLHLNLHLQSRGGDMRTIEIDDQVWEALQMRASPFEDTPNSVLRRVFVLDKQEKGKELTPQENLAGLNTAQQHLQEPRGSGSTAIFKPQREYRVPIAITLLRMGGRGAASDVLDKIGDALLESLLPADHQMTSAREPRWRNLARWERNQMIKEGLLKRDSPYGIWELTERGMKLASRLTKLDVHREAS
jgi:Mrr N-terminal domain